MSLKLKSRINCPPDGFRYVQSVTKWKSWEADPNSQWNFRLLCALVQQHRINNRRLGLDTDIRHIEAEVDRVNAERVAAIPGGDSYIMAGEVMPPPKTSPQQLASQAVAAVGSSLLKMAQGGANLIDWLKDGGVAVARPLAESRAVVCVTCPKNGTGNLTKWFTVPASALIQKQLEARNDLDLKTSVDDKLHVCVACLCPMKLKVHEPIEHIKKHTSDAVKSDLAPQCWILKELSEP